MKYANTDAKSECPLCGSFDAKYLYRLSSHDATRYLRSEDDKQFKPIKKIIEGLWGKDYCEKFQCNDCKLIYVKPFVGGNEDFYSRMYDEELPYPNAKSEFDYTLEDLKVRSIMRTKYNKELSLLEIGAGKGAFLKLIPEYLIKKKNLFANEISKHSAEALKEMGIKNYPDLYSEDVDRRFDVIAFFGVIEHLDNLHKLFERMSELLNDGGSIYLSTHETSKVFFFENNNAGLDVPPTHISCWNRKSFDYLCELYNFEYVDDEYFNLSFMRKLINFGMGMFELGKMKKGSVEDKINSMKSRKKRKFLIYCYLAMNLPYILYKTFGRTLVSKQWVHLKKRRKE